MTDKLPKGIRDLKITLVIWAALLVLAIFGLIILNANSERILNHIYAVNVSRAAKAAVLYAAAENEARSVLSDFEKRNAGSKKILVPSTDPRIQKVRELYSKAGDLDLKPEFDPERAQNYELLAQVYDAAGLREEQLLGGARAFMARRDFADASDYINKAESLTSHSLTPIIIRAQLLQMEGQTSQALALLSDFESSRPLEAKGLSVRAALSLEAGDPLTAISYYKKAVAQQPENLNYRKSLADAQASQGHMGEATKTLQEGLDDGGWMDPAYLHVYGDYLVAKGDFEEAIRILKQSDKLAPQSGDVQWSLARAYHKAGKSREAASALRRATEVKPELHDRIF